MQKIEIAQLFSLGQLQDIDQYFATDIQWDIIGEQKLHGIGEVFKYCQNIFKYFKSVECVFSINNIYETSNTVIIDGFAIFRSDDAENHIAACDIYSFNQKNKITSIKSYCIPIKIT